MFERYALENAEGERDGAKIKALYKQFGAPLSNIAHWAPDCLCCVHFASLQHYCLQELLPFRQYRLVHAKSGAILALVSDSLLCGQ